MSWSTPGIRTDISEIEAMFLIDAYYNSPDEVINADEGTEITVQEFIEALLDMADDTEDAFPEWRDCKVNLPTTQVGEWSISNHKIAWDDRGRIRYLLVEGIDRDCGWDDGTLTTCLRRDGVIWMSDTKAEIFEHLPFIEHVKASQPSSILITGLGIGMIAQWACRQPYIDHVTVVELDESLVDFMAPLIDSDKLTIVKADATTWVPERAYDCAWHDIWSHISDENIPEMEAMKAQYAGFVTGVQMFWQEAGCHAMKKNLDEFSAALRAGDWARVKQLDPDF